MASKKKLVLDVDDLNCIKCPGWCDKGYFLGYVRLSMGDNYIDMHMEAFQIRKGVNKSDQKYVHAVNKQWDATVAQHLGSAPPFNIVEEFPETIKHKGKEYLVIISPFQE